MLFAARLATFGFWGLFDPAMTFDMSAGQSYQAATLNRSGNTGLYALRWNKSFLNGEKTFGGGNDSAIMLRYSVVFPLLFNDIPAIPNPSTSWTVHAGGADYFKQFANAFRYNAALNSVGQGVGFTRAEANVAGQWTHPAVITGPNMSFSVQMFILDPPEEQEDHEIILAWDNWLFRIKEGSPEIKLNRPDWEWQNLSFGSGDSGVKFDGFYNNPFTLTFIPEPRGALNVILEGVGADTIEVPHIIATRQFGTLWNASVLSVSTNGGALTWQTGYPKFIDEGILRFGERANKSWVNNLGSMVVNGQADAELVDPTLDGTNIVVEKVDVGANSFEILATLSTTNERYTPFLYSASATITAGERNGSTTTSFDTDNHFENGTTIIEEITPSFEGEMRRLQYEGQIRDVNGLAIPDLGFWHESIENRIASLSATTTLYNGGYLVRNGIVKTSQMSNMAEATSGLLKRYIATSNTKCNFVICDQWARLDEDIMYELPVGDGMRLWDYVRLILKNAGIRANEMTGVPAGTGIVLPTAAPGESYCIRPSGNQMRGDYLRSVIDKWGMGWYLWQNPDNGTWTTRAPQNSVATDPASSLPFAFHKSANGGNSPDNFPGRYAILAPLDFIRDFEEQYNFFRVIGAKDAYGRPIVATWDVKQSISQGFTPGSKLYIGRRKCYPDVIDEGIRTQSWANYVVRSLFMRYGQPGRYLSFETYFHPRLYPGDCIAVDGVLARAKRISGSMARDRMTIMAQEIV